MAQQNSYLNSTLANQSLRPASHLNKNSLYLSMQEFTNNLNQKAESMAIDLTKDMEAAKKGGTFKGDGKKKARKRTVSKKKAAKGQDRKKFSTS